MKKQFCILKCVTLFLLLIPAAFSQIQQRNLQVNVPGFGTNSVSVLTFGNGATATFNGGTGEIIISGYISLPAMFSNGNTNWLQLPAWQNWLATNTYIKSLPPFGTLAFSNATTFMTMLTGLFAPANVTNVDLSPFPLKSALGNLASSNATAFSMQFDTNGAAAAVQAWVTAQNYGAGSLNTVAVNSLIGSNLTVFSVSTPMFGNGITVSNSITLAGASGGGAINGGWWAIDFYGGIQTEGSFRAYSSNIEGQYLIGDSGLYVGGSSGYSPFSVDSSGNAIVNSISVSNGITLGGQTRTNWPASSGGGSTVTNVTLSHWQGDIVTGSTASRISPYGRFAQFQDAGSTLCFFNFTTPNGWTTNQTFNVLSASVSGISTATYRLCSIPFDGTTNTPTSFTSTNFITVISGASRSYSNLVTAIPAGDNYLCLQFVSGNTNLVSAIGFSWK